MTMPPGLRKAALVAHVTSSVGWMGAVFVFLVLAVAGVASDDEQSVRAAYIAMGLATTYVIVPFALATVVTGVAQSLGTHWGLLRHYWVIIKLVVTVAATTVLLLKVGSIHRLADLAAASPGELDAAAADRSSLVVHAGGGLLVLLVPMALSVYKPRGVTRRGRRHLLRRSPGEAPG